MGLGGSILQYGGHNDVLHRDAIGTSSRPWESERPWLNGIAATSDFEPFTPKQAWAFDGQEGAPLPKTMLAPASLSPTPSQGGAAAHNEPKAKPTPDHGAEALGEQAEATVKAFEGCSKQASNEPKAQGAAKRGAEKLDELTEVADSPMEGSERARTKPNAGPTPPRGPRPAIRQDVTGSNRQPPSLSSRRAAWRGREQTHQVAYSALRAGQRKRCCISPPSMIWIGFI